MSTESTNRESILRRIRKLLAIAQDHRADPNEAASAAAMAERIMRKHQVEHADLIEQELKSKDAITWKSVFAKMKMAQPSKVVPLWAQWLCVRVAKFHDCEASLGWDDHSSGARSRCLIIYGFNLDVVVAAWTFDYLRDELIRATRQFNKDAPRTKAQSNSFRHGFVVALIRSLKEAENSKRRELEAPRTKRRRQRLRKCPRGGQGARNRRRLR